MPGPFSIETQVAIDRAVADERERCAKAASNEQYEDELGPQEAAWNQACIQIANVIRGHG